MEWIELSKVRPSEGDSVIAFSIRDGVNYDVYVDFSSSGQLLWQRNGRCNMEDVTHWQYSIKPPNSEESGSGQNSAELKPIYDWFASVKHLIDIDDADNLYKILNSLSYGEHNKQRDVILLEIAEGLKSSLLKKDGTVHFQANISHESFTKIIESQN